MSPFFKLCWGDFPIPDSRLAGKQAITVTISRFRFGRDRESGSRGRRAGDISWSGGLPVPWLTFTEDCQCPDTHRQAARPVPVTVAPAEPVRLRVGFILPIYYYLDHYYEQMDRHCAVGLGACRVHTVRSVNFRNTASGQPARGKPEVPVASKGPGRT